MRRAACALAVAALVAAGTVAYLVLHPDPGGWEPWDEYEVDLHHG